MTRQVAGGRGPVVIILSIFMISNVAQGVLVESSLCPNPNSQSLTGINQRCYANITNVDFWSDLLQSVLNKLYVNEITENLETIEQHVLTDLYETVQRILPETFRERSDLIRYLRERTTEIRQQRESDHHDSLLDRIVRSFNVGFDGVLSASNQTSSGKSAELSSSEAAGDSKNFSPSRIPNTCASRFTAFRRRLSPIGELIFVHDVAEMWSRNTKLQERQNRAQLDQLSEERNANVTGEGNGSENATSDQQIHAPAESEAISKEQLATALTVCYATIFYLAHCPFSRELLATLELISRHYVPTIPIFAIDAERSARHWNTKFGVVCVPTLFVFEERKAIAKYNLSSYKLKDVVDWLSAVLGTKLTINGHEQSTSDISSASEGPELVASGNFDVHSELQAIETRLTDAFGQLSAMSAADSTLCLAWITVLLVSLVTFFRSTYGTVVLRHASVVIFKLHVGVRNLLRARVRAH